MTTTAEEDSRLFTEKAAVKAMQCILTQELRESDSDANSLQCCEWTAVTEVAFDIAEAMETERKRRFKL